MKRKWIVVANRTGARVFKAKPFSLLKVFRNDLGREKNRAMTTDKPGWSRSKLAKPSSTHALTGELSQHEEAAKQFARRLSRYLSVEGSLHRFDELLIAAEPKMLGRMRLEFGKELAKACIWLKKDMVHLSNLEVGKNLGLVPSRARAAE